MKSASHKSIACTQWTTGHTQAHSRHGMAWNGDKIPIAWPESSILFLFFFSKLKTAARKFDMQNKRRLKINFGAHFHNGISSIVLRLLAGWLRILLRMFYILFGWTRAQFLIWRSSFIRMDVLLALEANNSLLLFYFILFYCKCALAIIFQTISEFFFRVSFVGFCSYFIVFLFSFFVFLHRFGHCKWFQMKIKNVK